MGIAVGANYAPIAEAERHPAALDQHLVRADLCTCESPREWHLMKHKRKRENETSAELS